MTRSYKIAAAEKPRHPVLRLTFDDGFAGEVDFSSTIAKGGIFAFLADPAAFATVQIGERGRSLVWLDPKGEEVDFCADAVRFQAEEQVVRERAARYVAQGSPSE
jgi:hypothetical protein